MQDGIEVAEINEDDGKYGNKKLKNLILTVPVAKLSNLAETPLTARKKKQKTKNNLERVLCAARNCFQSEQYAAARFLYSPRTIVLFELSHIYYRNIDI